MAIDLKADLAPVKLLDCTLRDGGYYNDWDFSLSEAQDYVDNLARGGVHIIEIGFRFTPKSRFLGPFAYSREDVLRQLTLPPNVEFGVMINAADYLRDSWRQDLEAAFVPAAESAVTLVRIAAHIREIPQCDKLVEWLKAAGYRVGLNVMQISQASDEKITDLIEDIEARFVPFEALYFADSLGNLTSDDVTRIVGLFQASSDKPIGFHGHDNIGLGVANSMAALAAGATWVDSTVTGMGRGAGNTQTEYLSLEMVRRGYADFDLLSIQRAATGWLATLKETCRWGTNIFYYEAGLRSLHPSYVQQMISSKRYEPIDILVMIAALANTEAPTSYREANIDRALTEMMAAPIGRDDITDRWNGRPVMLVASGQQAVRHWPAIVRFAKARNAAILAVNHISGLSTDAMDGVVCIHPARMMALLSDKTWSDLPLFTARDVLPDNLRATLAQHQTVVDYGVQVTPGNTLTPKPQGCVISAPEAIGYAWAIAQQGGASELLLAGFDGYDGQSPSFHKANALLSDLQEHSSLKVSSVTATHYSLPQISIYGI